MKRETLRQFSSLAAELPPVLGVKPPLSHPRASAEKRTVRFTQLVSPTPQNALTRPPVPTARAKARCSTAHTTAGEEQVGVGRGEAVATAEAARPAHYARAQGTARRGHSHMR